MRLLLTTPLLLLLGCPSEEDLDDPIAICVDTHSEANGGDFESDMWHIGCAQPMEGDPVECEPPTVAEIEAECAADGHDCSGQIAVTRDAAQCIAEAQGMVAGLEGIQVDLMYIEKEGLPCWAVSNVLTSADGASSGESLRISAVDGAVLEESQWEAMP